MRGTITPGEGGVTGIRFALVAAALLGLLVAQVGGAVGASADQQAASSVVTDAKFKKLKKRVAALEAKPARNLAATERPGGRRPHRQQLPEPGPVARSSHSGEDRDDSGRPRQVHDGRFDPEQHPDAGRAGRRGFRHGEHAQHELEQFTSLRPDHRDLPGQRPREAGRHRERRANRRPLPERQPREQPRGRAPQRKRCDGPVVRLLGAADRGPVRRARPLPGQWRRFARGRSGVLDALGRA